MVFSPEPTSKHRPGGFLYGAVHAGLKPEGVPDLAWLGTDPPAHAAARFAPNSTAPAVLLSRDHLHEGAGVCQGILVHAGVANVDVEHGTRDARTLVDRAAAEASLPGTSVLLAGTGERGRPLPDSMADRIPELLESSRADRVEDFADAIRTDDGIRKLASAEGIVDGRRTRILGIAKGHRNVHPRFCTTLAFLLTDATVRPDLLDSLLQSTVAPIFDAMRVDGGTSPADTLLAMASGQSGGPPVLEGDLGARTLQAGLAAVTQVLARQIIEDASHPESIVQRWQLSVSSAGDDERASLIADRIAVDHGVQQDLVESRPCLESILAVLETLDDVDPQRVSVQLDRCLLMKDGARTGASTDSVFRKPLASVRVDLGRDAGRAIRWVAARGNMTSGTER